MDVYVVEIHKLENKFSGLEIHHVIRDDNVGADVLSKLGSDRANVSCHTLSDPGLRDCVHNVVHTGLGDRTCPLPYLCCTLLVCEVGLVGTEGNYLSCTRVRFLG
jgi:hypothetical protein